MTWFFTLILFLLGAAWGSFLYVVAWRMPQKKDFIKGRSACAACAKQLSFWEVMPIVSYIALKGRCRHCDESISWHYFAAEVVMGLLFIAGFEAFGLTYEFALFFFELSILTLIFLVDLYTGWVYEMVVTPAILVILAAQLLLGGDPGAYIIGLVIGMLVFWVQYAGSKGRWIGKGDIWIGALMGVILGWKMLWVGLASAYLLGGVIAIYLVMTQRKKRGDSVPFGPFLTAGTLIALVWGQQILDWYLGLLGLPF